MPLAAPCDSRPANAASTGANGAAADSVENKNTTGGAAGLQLLDPAPVLLAPLLEAARALAAGPCAAAAVRPLEVALHRRLVLAQASPALLQDPAAFATELHPLQQQQRPATATAAGPLSTTATATTPTLLTQALPEPNVSRGGPEQTITAALSIRSTATTISTRAAIETTASWERPLPAGEAARAFDDVLECAAARGWTLLRRELVNVG